MSETVRRGSLAAACGTHPGRVRDHNEDDCYLDLEGGVLLLVDGVGGQAAGEVAAAIAVDTIRQRLERRDGPAETRIREAITLANRQILAAAAASPAREGMACVLTLALLEGRALTIGHVGDSRFYKLTSEGITKLTHDHSPVGELEDAGLITETAAMQHPRRHEVFRDVGSGPRDPDASDFIEIVSGQLEDDAAILLCSDGLSDMLTSLEINRLARTHAGHPTDVVAALIDAANDAGGKDNITVLYAEGPEFRRAHDGGRSFPPRSRTRPQVDTIPLPGLLDAPEIAVHGLPAVPAPATASSGRSVARVIASRSALLVLGALIGFGLAAYLFGTADTLGRVPASPLVVGGTAPGHFDTIAEAVAAARPGDLIEVEPGTYAEALEISTPVELRSRTTGAAVLVPPLGSQTWVGATVTAGGSVIRGFTIAGTAAVPAGVGLRISADARVDDVTFEGPMAAGIEIAGEGAAIVQFSRFQTSGGAAVRVTGPAAPTIRRNLFIAGGGAGAGARVAAPAIHAEPGSTPLLDGNLFVRFPRVLEPATRPDLLGDDNFVIAPEPRPTR